MLIQQVAGGTVKWGQLPVYLAAELLAGVVAAIAYTALVRGSDSAPAQVTELAALDGLGEPATRS